LELILLRQNSRKKKGKNRLKLKNRLSSRLLKRQK